MSDIRDRLRQADSLVRAKRFDDAVAIYNAVAEEYRELGFALKSAAVSRHVLELIDAHSPHLVSLRNAVLLRLLDLYTELGLTEEVARTRLLLS